jgi:hypothetical protein
MLIIEVVFVKEVKRDRLVVLGECLLYPSIEPVPSGHGLLKGNDSGQVLAQLWVANVFCEPLMMTCPPENRSKVKGWKATEAAR